LGAVIISKQVVSNLEAWGTYHLSFTMHARILILQEGGRNLPPKPEIKNIEKTLVIPSLLEKAMSKLHTKCNSERFLEKMDWKLRHKMSVKKAGFQQEETCHPAQ